MEDQEHEELLNQAEKALRDADALSAASTSLFEIGEIEKEQAKLRKIRSDLGSTHRSKKKDQKAKKAIERAEAELLRISEKRPVGRPKTRQIERMQFIDEDAPAARREGTGLNRIKPPKRKTRTNKEELMKNRLRLVASQIEAGNTNPKLINEVNKLYKTLYDIDNAYMLLKK